MQITLTHHTVALLAQTIGRVIDGTAPVGEVVTALRRVCEETRDRPAELVLLRIKALWRVRASQAGDGVEERDRRYLSFLAQYLRLHYAPLPMQPADHAPVRNSQRGYDARGCGESAAVPLRERAMGDEPRGAEPLRTDYGASDSPPGRSGRDYAPSTLRQRSS